MTFHLAVVCDEDGCEERAEVVGHNANGGPLAVPVVVDNGSAWWETEWTDPPAGWVFAAGGVRCPAHAGEVSALSSEVVPNERRSDGE